jgi:cytochrome c1
MNVAWGVHPNNLGHNDFPGCFRCHDGSHTSADGQTITNNCTACHNLLAVQDENPKYSQIWAYSDSRSSWHAERLFQVW